MSEIVSAHHPDDEEEMLKTHGRRAYAPKVLAQALELEPLNPLDAQALEQDRTAPKIEFTQPGEFNYTGRQMREQDLFMLMQSAFHSYFTAGDRAEVVRLDSIRQNLKKYFAFLATQAEHQRMELDIEYEALLLEEHMRWQQHMVELMQHQVKDEAQAEVQLREELIHGYLVELDKLFTQTQQLHAEMATVDREIHALSLEHALHEEMIKTHDKELVEISSEIERQHRYLDKALHDHICQKLGINQGKSTHSSLFTESDKIKETSDSATLSRHVRDRIMSMVQALRIKALANQLQPLGPKDMAAQVVETEVVRQQSLEVDKEAKPVLQEQEEDAQQVDVEASSAVDMVPEPPAKTAAELHKEQLIEKAQHACKELEAILANAMHRSRGGACSAERRRLEFQERMGTRPSVSKLVSQFEGTSAKVTELQQRHEQTTRKRSWTLHRRQVVRSDTLKKKAKRKALDANKSLVQLRILQYNKLLKHVADESRPLESVRDIQLSLPNRS